MFMSEDRMNKGMYLLAWVCVAYVFVSLSAFFYILFSY